jgi:hypothetical protein
MNHPSLYTVKAILILDADGQRIVGKYFDDQFPSIKEQKTFEQTLFTKTNKASGEIVMIDNMTIVYRSSIDLFFYVVGSSSENEIMLTSVLSCLFESISQILRKQVEKRYLLDYLDAAFLSVDEICDNGILLETDPSVIAQRVVNQQGGGAGGNSGGGGGMELSAGEQTVMDVVKSARDQLKWSLLR